jgi:DNA polymerase III delta prime subunit
MFELYYGPPGSGKTRAIIELIRQIYKETGKKARVFVGDGSGAMYNQIMHEGCIAGLADFSIRDQPFTTCQQITEGMWPSDVNDPLSKMRKLTPAEIAETSVWVYEGMSVMGNYMMGDKPGGLAQRAADGESLGGDYVVSFADSDTYKFGGNSVVHYNLGQRHLLQNVLRSKVLNGMVIWTAHERMDDGQRSEGMQKGNQGTKFTVSEKIIGPELIGKALTQNISRDFGNTLHFDSVSKKVADGTDELTGKTKYTSKTEYRIYTRDHFDPEGLVAQKYRAVNRFMGDPAKMPEYIVANEPGAALLRFYDILKGKE